MCIFLLPSYDITKTWLVGFNDSPRATFIMMFQEQHQHCDIRSCFPSGYLICKHFLNLPPWKCIRSQYCNIKSHTVIYHGVDEYLCAIHCCDWHSWCRFVLCTLFYFTLEAFMCEAFEPTSNFPVAIISTLFLTVGQWGPKV